MSKILKAFSLLGLFLLVPVAVVAQSAHSDINPAVVVVSNDELFGMGWVISKDFVVTARHVVVSWNTGKLIPSETVTFAPDFHKKLKGIIVAVDDSRDLALIHVPTGNIRPIKLSDKIQDGGYIYWNLPGDMDRTQFQRVCAQLVGRLNKTYVDCKEKPCIELNYYEKFSPPVGSELLLVASRDSKPGSSGGVVTQNNGEAIGLMVLSNSSKNISKIVSSAGIRRFLAEHHWKIIQAKMYTTLRSKNQ